MLLLAEDHPINQRVLVHQLGIIGFHVDTADDGQEALELFARGRYGLVLTDLNMPVIQAGSSVAEDGALEPDGVVDAVALEELTGGDHELAAAILVDFVDSSSSDLASLRAALDDANGDEVRRQAHRIKGASRTVGAHQVATVAAAIEEAASTTIDDWPAVRAAAEDLGAAVARVAASVTGPTAA